MSIALHVESTRRGPGDANTGGLPLVCLHGWGMNLRVFDTLRAALPAGRDSHAIDLAGHGRSPWVAGHAGFEAQLQDVLAVLPARCVLLGWSFGGKLAMELAAREPARIAALVLVSATPKFAQSDDWPHGLDAGAMQAFRALLEQDWQQTLSDFVWLQLRGSRNAEAAQAALEAALTTQGAPHAQALRHGLDLLGALDLRSRVPHIRQPVLVVSGQNDRVTPPGASRWLAAALADARLIEIARAGHASFASHPQQFSAALHQFLATSVAAA